MQDKKLVLGLPNGSLFEPTVGLLERVGITVKASGRNFVADIKGADIFKKALIMRPQDVPEAIADGVIDAGICGWDCVAEAELAEKVVKIAELPYGRNSRRPVWVVIFGKGKELFDEEWTLVAAEYPNLAKRFFKKAKIRFSHGTTEAKVAYDRYNYGVGVVESGRSLADNGLNILNILLVSPTVLVAREQSPEVEYFGRLLKGGFEAENYRLIKMDVNRRDKEKILAILPAIQSPTVNRLANGNYAIETVAKKDEAVDLIFQLQKLGAKGILAQEINILL
ncbi:MAG: ATP phosphoribosyltransferase [Patescibacteria group bacterium]|nr:ATP phosphoribosyltransferase [Patescibacteria group bacterium]